jgi:two-component system, NtrC family, sensor kinase
MLLFLLIVMLNISPVTQPDQLFVASDSLFNNNGIINLAHRSGWRFHPGDDLSWADPDLDDSDWMLYKPAGLTDPIPDSLWQGYGWFRFHFVADSSAYANISNLYFSTYGAAEVYLDGKLIKQHSVFSTNLQDEKRYMSSNSTFPVCILYPSESHVLAVRFSYHKGKQYKELLGKYAGSFGFSVGLGTDNQALQVITRHKRAQQELFILGTMLMLIVMLHGYLFALFPAEKSNLHITIMVFLLFLHVIVSYGGYLFEYDVWSIFFIRYIPFLLIFMAAVSMFPFTMNSMLKQKPRKIHKVLIMLFPLITLANFILSGPVHNPVIAIVFPSVIIYFSAQVLIQAWRNNQKGVWIVAVAFSSVIIAAVTWVFYSKYAKNFSNEVHSFLMYMIYGSIPLGLTALMASRFRDLYKNLEQKVHDRTFELQQSLDNLRSTQTQLIHAEKLASLGALTAGIAHEIQNPLNFVNNFSEVNQELLSELKEELAEGSRHLANNSRHSAEEKIKSAGEIANDLIGNEQKISHHGKRAEAIVKGMLLHSRGSSGHKEPTDINALCDEYLRLSYHGFRAKDKSFNAEYKTDFAPDLPQINVVPQDIGRVLLNLVNNAFYAVSSASVKTTHALSQPSSDNPCVIVATRNLGDRIEITVKDNGPGIPAEIVDKIFQPFFTTKPTGQGTGLGLSLAYDIVKAHGGEIKLEPSEEYGTEFKIYLPLN